MINGHGDDLHQHEEIKHNFSSNVYYKGCSPLLMDVLKDAVTHIQNYPSPLAYELNVLAAKHFQLDEKNFLFANGATEAFYLIAQKFAGKSATIVAPTFSEYEDACRIYGITTQFIQRSAIETTDFNTDLVFICNPNNPNGAILSLATLEQLFIRFPKAHFIIDEAYNEFTSAVKSALPLIQKYNNLSIVRSLTKTFAIPGLRLGYLVSNTPFIDDLLQLKMPWTVNSMAIEAGKFIFNNYASLSFDLPHLLKETEVFKNEINAIYFLAVVPGNTTYFLVELKKGTASELKNHLISKHQILIRDATNFTGLEGEYVRFSVQSKEANNVLINALKQWH